MGRRGGAFIKPCLAILAMSLVGACAAPPPTPTNQMATPTIRMATPTSQIATPATVRVVDAPTAVRLAESLTSIHGPRMVEEVTEGTYADLWRGSTNDMSGEQAAELRVIGPRVAWGVSLKGPDGSEELILDRETGRVLGAITQGQ